jgi:hypothetical protein
VSRLVQVTVAGDVTEAEEVQGVLISAGIESELESAVDEHPEEHGDTPVKVLVAEEELDAARDAIEALTEPDELIDK